LQKHNEGCVKRGDVSEVEICPVCGSENDCGMAKRQETCWCFAMPHTLPVAATEEANRCYCRACLARMIADMRRGSEAPRS